MNSGQSEAPIHQPFVSLDWIRGLAAVWVFTFHYGFSQQFTEVFPTLHAFFRMGDLGVPIFFVISGYCMAMAVQRSREQGRTINHFLSRRFLRIYPTFWCSIAVTIAIPFIIEALSFFKTGVYAGLNRETTSNGWLRYGAADWFELFTLTRVFTPMPEVLDLQSKFNSINAVYWTLAIEVQFYLVVSVAVLPRVSLRVLNTALILIGLLWGYLMPGDTSGLFIPYWPLFGCGVILSSLLAWGYPKAWLAECLRWTGLILIPALILCLHHHWLSVCGCFTIWLWLLSSTNDRWIITRRWKFWGSTFLPYTLSILGLASYSIYLLHGRLMHLANQLSRQVFPINSIGADVTTLIITLLLCFGFYFCAERPFVARRSKPRTKSAE